ncbi:MAG: DUF362 domain-containing protein [Anaerolineae bacterium]|nr:DUF362 domain-containing protein [Anaerolineae bacterium]
MKIHPLLNDPQAVLIVHLPPSNPVCDQDYRRTAEKALAAMQIELEGENAVIKPNVTVGELYADPDSGITTHPSFVWAMVDYLGQHGARQGGIYILEDPRNSNDSEPRHWRGTGYDEMAAQAGVKLRCPNAHSCVKKPVPKPLARSELPVSRLAVAPNTVLFNVPKLKTHNLALTTLCLKNLMGVVDVFERHFCAQAWQELPEEVRSNPRPRHEWLDRATHKRWQEGLARRLVDTARVVTPQLNLVEGVVGREGTGFQRGLNRSLGLAVAGINMVAVDSVASYLMGFDPQQLIYLRVAAAAGLGTNDLAQLRIYAVQDEAIVPCPDVDALRAQPPFRVISGLAGEENWLDEAKVFAL